MQYLILLKGVYNKSLISEQKANGLIWSYTIENM